MLLNPSVRDAPQLGVNMEIEGEEVWAVEKQCSLRMAEGHAFLNVTLGACTFGSGTCAKLCFYFLPSADFDGYDKKEQCKIYGGIYRWDLFKDTDDSIMQCPLYEGPWEKFISGIRKSCISVEQLWCFCPMDTINLVADCVSLLSQHLGRIEPAIVVQLLELIKARQYTFGSTKFTLGCFSSLDFLIYLFLHFYNMCIFPFLF